MRTGCNTLLPCHWQKGAEVTSLGGIPPAQVIELAKSKTTPWPPTSHTHIHTHRHRFGNVINTEPSTFVRPIPLPKPAELGSDTLLLWLYLLKVRLGIAAFTSVSAYMVGVIVTTVTFGTLLFPTGIPHRSGNLCSCSSGLQVGQVTQVAKWAEQQTACLITPSPGSISVSAIHCQLHRPLLHLGWSLLLGHVYQDQHQLQECRHRHVWESKQQVIVVFKPLLRHEEASGAHLKV